MVVELLLVVVVIGFGGGELMKSRAGIFEGPHIHTV